jgi:hypothetical protein
MTNRHWPHSRPSAGFGWQRMTYHFRLQRSDGLPADPPTYRSIVFSWQQGDTIPLGASRPLGVVAAMGNSPAFGRDSADLHGRTWSSRRRGGFRKSLHGSCLVHLAVGTRGEGPPGRGGPRPLPSLFALLTSFPCD